MSSKSPDYKAGIQGIPNNPVSYPRNLDLESKVEEFLAEELNIYTTSEVAEGIKEDWFLVNQSLYNLRNRGVVKIVLLGASQGGSVQGNLEIRWMLAKHAK